MLNFPKTTEFGRRVPKQKFYEHLDVTPELRKRAKAVNFGIIYGIGEFSLSEAFRIAAGSECNHIFTSPFIKTCR